MRLLIATPLYPPESGGPATYARLLEQGLPFSVTVVKFTDVRTYPKGIRHGVYFWKVYKAAKYADVVLALDPVSVGLPALVAARLRRKPFVVKVVGDYAWEQGVQRFGINDTLDDFVTRTHVPFPVTILRAIQTHVVSSAIAVIVPSRYLKTIVSNWGIPDTKISVIYNAIELETGGVVPGVVQKSPHPCIVTVGRLVPWKQIDRVIDAVASMGKDVSLVVVGDGPERKRLEEKGTSLGDRIIFTGALPHADTLACIAAADVFILNSSYEGLSHVLIESLMLGKPIVATSAGGNTELVRDRVNGTIISPTASTQELALALMRALDGDMKAEQLLSESRAARERFSVSSMCAETASLLERL